MKACLLYIYSVHISVECMESSKTQDMVTKMDLLAQLGWDIYTALGLENHHNHDHHQGRQFSSVRRSVVTLPFGSP